MKENQETKEAWGADDSGKDETGQSSVQSLLKDFCDYTSAHGPSRVCGAKRMFQKVLWSLLFVGAVTMFTYQILLLYKKFQSRPLSTHIRMEHDSVSKASVLLYLTARPFVRPSKSLASLSCFDKGDQTNFEWCFWEL